MPMIPQRRLFPQCMGVLFVSSLGFFELASAFVVTAPSHVQPVSLLPISFGHSSHRSLERPTQLFLADAASDTDDDDENIEPGKMRVSEIKAELDLRGVSYADCFDKESLEKRLVNARETGKANPELLEKFNKQRLEDTFQENKPVEEAMSDETLLNQAVGNDGNLPGGLSPQQFQQLVENPEIMALLQSPKMQEAMKLMMTGGPEDLQKAMADDPELLEIVKKLNKIMQPSSSNGGGE